MTVKYLRRTEVQEMTGLSRSTIYDWMEKGTFPRPVRLGSKSVRWLETVIAEWLASKEETKPFFGDVK